jgi:hypothetical protein
MNASRTTTFFLASGNPAMECVLAPPVRPHRHSDPIAKQRANDARFRQPQRDVARRFSPADLR